MNAVYDAVLSAEEKARVTRLELFDEFEEWRMIQSHYFLLWAFRTDDPPSMWQVRAKSKSMTCSRSNRC